MMENYNYKDEILKLDLKDEHFKLNRNGRRVELNDIGAMIILGNFFKPYSIGVNDEGNIILHPSDMQFLTFVLFAVDKRVNYNVFNGSNIAITSNEVTYMFNKFLGIKYFNRTYKWLLRFLRFLIFCNINVVSWLTSASNITTDPTDNYQLISQLEKVKKF